MKKTFVVEKKRKRKLDPVIDAFHNGACAWDRMIAENRRRLIAQQRWTRERELRYQRISPTA